MKKKAFQIALVLALASMIVMVGCESDDDDDSDATAPSGLSISPASATIPALIVSNILFTASNGVGTYSWSVESPALGSLVISGSSAIYTSTTNTGINYIHVVDSSNNTATASVNHL
ncbi:MAG: hypothetical protein A2283_11385 [Lentisphaerae bacterium RIFOXYA12_FULL_48_11]|nr:MAG: hypothetical protein A2283_11385 [Lentisphaerae bacterium RIFOXYA12_FULL_48_11]